MNKYILYKAEYHRFIPRFLLRQFAAAEQPPPLHLTRRQRRRPGNGRPQAQSSNFINAIDLTRNVLIRVLVSREFGLVDMYPDRGYQNPRHIEDDLGRLEDRAARIIRRSSDTFKADRTLELTRYERDSLRKSLFLMKYRNSTLCDRYNYDSITAYDSNDKHRLESYMREKGFKSSRDVWYTNLKAFLDLEMGPDMLWISKVHGQAFPEHKKKSSSDSLFDQATEKLVEGAYAEYHNFAPISAKLIIVLRNAEDLQSEWNRMREMKCGDSYSTIINGKPVLKPNRGSRSEDRFYFTCFRISSYHINLINSVFLEEALKANYVHLRDKTIELPKPEVHMSQWVALVVGSKMVELSRKSKVLKVYKLMKPDGIVKTYFDDLKQAQHMDDRLDVKFHLQQLYQGFPAQRVWLYLKVMQNLPNFDERDFKKQVHELEIHGQEDDVAKFIALFPSCTGQLIELMLYKSQMTALTII
ncbi:hypothetical protein BDV23DRAFT_196393 [Aspergillus alliaceus]|uniref:Uncharacterized protein n=1 Tax=Petromyces alliaceus TaxID=209559 RepID=A0A5N7BX78_PETAA|nr:hypothetical protein BDV23DRAFT_196393 [Aspergillus alliaceus]